MSTSRVVVLVEPYWTRAKDPRVPLGHASLLAALRQAGVRVHSLPVAVNQAMLDVGALSDSVLAASAGSDVSHVDVAIGAYVWGERVVQGLLASLRQRGFGGRIVLGGPQVSYAGAGLEALYPQADVFVRGYGERALVQLAQASGRPAITGVHHAGEPDRVEQSSVDLEALPSPWLEGFVPLAGQEFIRWETQRGCPFRCSFCQHREAGMRLRRRELARSRVCAEIDLFCRVGVREIAVLDPIFNQTRSAMEVLERFAANGFVGRLSLQCRAELLDDAFLDVASALDVRLELGLQTIHRLEGESIERANNIARVEAALRAIQHRDIDHEVSLIFGLPNQTLESFAQSVAWCLDRGVPTIKAFPLLLLRGTRLERERARWGLVDDGSAMAAVQASTTFTRDDWHAMSQIAEVLRRTEGRHPNMRDLLALSRATSPDLQNWQAGSGS